ncbi:ABC transporter substrate-binding protein, partial [Roseateles sp. GG27B]
MAARSGVAAAEYLPLLKGTRLLTLDDNRQAYLKSKDYTSIYGSTETVNTFNWYNKVYTISQKVD